MTVSADRIGASSTLSKWKTIDWQTVDKNVLRLQMRIAKAIREGNHCRAKTLQWILSLSYYAKLLAIKRVSQNKGSKTPGVDGIIWNTDKKKMPAVELFRRRRYHPHLMRSVYIPKKMVSNSH